MRTGGSAEQRADSLLEAMSLREKVRLMTGSTSLLRMAVDHYLLGHYNRTAYGTRGLKRLGIPPVLFSDGPRGVVMGRATCFPVSMARGASWDPGLEERIGEAMAREIRALGGNFFGGVCVNLLRHPAWGRAQETYGEDPHLLGEMGSALVRGVQRHNVMACVKHFACNSIENSRFKLDVRLEERTLREVYLPHFRRCLEAGAAAVMGAYNRVRGEHCCQNRYLLNDILREEWGFTGIVMSDFLYALHDTPKAALAGLDIEMPIPRFYGPRLVAAVRRGEVPETAVDRSVRRILATVLRFAAAADPQAYPRSLVACPGHVALAQEAAEKSLVLLKNEEGLLPLDRGRVRRLAVVGRLARRANLGDRGSSRVHPPGAVTPLAGLGGLLGGAAEILYDSGADPTRAAAAARRADAAVVVVGCDHRDEGEYLTGWAAGGDRKSLRLRPEDEGLIESVAGANPACAVVMTAGSAVVMEPWCSRVPAILMAWYPGMEGGTALARALFGEVCPGGKLPFTIPRREEGLPFFDPAVESIEYGYYHGYTLLERRGIEPAFAFGFGLSYTAFEFGRPQVQAGRERVEVRVDLANVGSRGGDEVVQLYVGPERSGVECPRKLLRGFRRVHLEPGERREVTLSVPYGELAWYDPERGVWRLDKARYHAWIGSSSRDEDLQKVEFTIR